MSARNSAGSRPSDRAEAFTPIGGVAVCACGSSYSEPAWRRLHFVGVMPGEREGEPIELRNCACGSTISRTAKETRTDLLRQIREAEAAGDWETVYALLQRVADRVREQRP